MVKIAEEHLVTVVKTKYLFGIGCRHCKMCICLLYLETWQSCGNVSVQFVLVSPGAIVSLSPLTLMPLCLSKSPFVADPDCLLPPDFSGGTDLTCRTELADLSGSDTQKLKDKFGCVKQNVPNASMHMCEQPVVTVTRRWTERRCENGA